MTDRHYLEELFLYYKPEVSIHKEGNFEIRCEVNMRDNRLLYFVREYRPEDGLDYCFSSNYEDVVNEFLERVNN